MKYLAIYFGSLLKWRGKSAWLTALAKAHAAELRHCPKKDAKLDEVDMG